MNLKNNSQQQFLQRLQAQAKMQAGLQQSKILPPQIDELSSLIARHPWQIILLLAGLSAGWVTMVSN